MILARVTTETLSFISLTCATFLSIGKITLLTKFLNDV